MQRREARQRTDAAVVEGAHLCEAELAQQRRMRHERLDAVEVKARRLAHAQHGEGGAARAEEREPCLFAHEKRPVQIELGERVPVLECAEGGIVELAAVLQLHARGVRREAHEGFVGRAGQCCVSTDTYHYSRTAAAA